MLHFDGLADVADGYWGSHDRARRLEIMSDSQIGAFGATAIALTIDRRDSRLSVRSWGAHMSFRCCSFRRSRGSQRRRAAGSGRPPASGGLGRSVMARPTVLGALPALVVLVGVMAAWWVGFGPEGTVLRRPGDRGCAGRAPCARSKVRGRHRRRAGGERCADRGHAVRRLRDGVVTVVRETVLLIVRHPETDANIIGTVRRPGRVPVHRRGTPAGAAAPSQARAVSSPTSSGRLRCCARGSSHERTSRLAGVPLQVDQRLIELDFGQAHGLTWEEITEAGIPFNYRSADEPVAPGGESRAAARGARRASASTRCAPQADGTWWSRTPVSCAPRSRTCCGCPARGSGSSISTTPRWHGSGCSTGTRSSRSTCRAEWPSGRSLARVARARPTCDNRRHLAPWPRGHTTSGALVDYDALIRAGARADAAVRSRSARERGPRALRPRRRPQALEQREPLRAVSRCHRGHAGGARAAQRLPRRLRSRAAAPPRRAPGCRRGERGRRQRQQRAAPPHRAGGPGPGRRVRLRVAELRRLPDGRASSWARRPCRVPLGEGEVHDLDAMLDADHRTHASCSSCATRTTRPAPSTRVPSSRRSSTEVPDHVLVVVDEAYFEYVDVAEYPDGLDVLRRRAAARASCARSARSTRWRARASATACCPSRWSRRSTRSASRSTSTRSRRSARTTRSTTRPRSGAAATRTRSRRPTCIRASTGSASRTCRRRRTSSTCTTEKPVEVFEALLAEGVIVRDFGTAPALRVGVGTPEDTRATVAAFEAVVAKLGPL